MFAVYAGLGWAVFYDCVAEFGESFAFEWECFGVGSGADVEVL